MRSTDAGDDLIQNFLMIAAIILIVTPRPTVSLIGLDGTFYIVNPPCYDIEYITIYIYIFNIYCIILRAILRI